MSEDKDALAKVLYKAYLIHVGAWTDGDDFDVYWNSLSERPFFDMRSRSEFRAMAEAVNSTPSSRNWGTPDSRLAYQEANASAQKDSPSSISGWRAMETAPRDGTAIIVAWGVSSSDPIVCEAYFYSEIEDDAEGNWHIANEHPSDYTAAPIYPEQWMPMPTVGPVENPTPAPKASGDT